VWRRATRISIHPSIRPQSIERTSPLPLPLCLPAPALCSRSSLKSTAEAGAGRDLELTHFLVRCTTTTNKKQKNH
jgi:hypothetical protein